MKYIVIKIGAMVLLLLALGGCAGQPNVPTTDEKNTSQEQLDDGKGLDAIDTAAENQEENQDEDVSQLEKSPLIQTLEGLVVNDADSVMVAAYVRDHMTEALPEEADRMIEILLHMQTQLIQKSHEGILYEPAYLDALNNTMGGVLDPNKISDIKDDVVRDFYQSVADSDLTMIRYEETPVLETDWEKIKAYQASFTDTFQMVVDFHIDNDLFREEDVASLVNRIYDMEDMLLKAPNSFAKDELTDLYNTYVSRMLAGPEGSYLYRLTDKTDAYAKKMATAIEGHEESGFAGVARTMMAEETKTFNHLIDIIDDYRLSNPYGKHHWEEVTTDEGQVKVSKLVYKRDDSIVTQRVNEMLKAASEDLIRSSGVSTEYSLDMYKTYQSGDKATVHLYMNYETDDGQIHYDERTLNLDLNHGTILTLNTLLKTSDAKLLDKVNTLSEADFTNLPTFSLTTTGLMLTGEIEDVLNRKVATITKDALLKIEFQTK